MMVGWRLGEFRALAHHLGIDGPLPRAGAPGGRTGGSGRLADILGVKDSLGSGNRRLYGAKHLRRLATYDRIRGLLDIDRPHRTPEWLWRLLMAAEITPTAGLLFVTWEGDNPEPRIATTPLLDPAITKMFFMVSVPTQQEITDAWKSLWEKRIQK